MIRVIIMPWPYAGVKTKLLSTARLSKIVESRCKVPFIYGTTPGV